MTDYTVKTGRLRDPDEDSLDGSRSSTESVKTASDNEEREDLRKITE